MATIIKIVYKKCNKMENLTEIELISKQAELMNVYKKVEYEISLIQKELNRRIEDHLKSKNNGNN